MKCLIPEISWHNKDPVLSVDFQPRLSQTEPLRLATGGADTHVVIWHVSISETGNVTLDAAADMKRHQKTVNVVRWSPCGKYLASGDDESFIFIWIQKTEKDPPAIFDQTEEQSKETWIVHKTLRGHLEDVYDISWNRASTHLVSGSVDNTALVWHVQRGKSSAMLSDHKGFVQGVGWDPCDQYIATISSDRVFRVYDINTKKVVSRSSKAMLPVAEGHPLHQQNVRLFYDDTLQTYFRRLEFSPDGKLIAVPSGYVEHDQTQPMNTVYIYSRYFMKVPACVLPCGSHPALAVRWSPIVYQTRSDGPPSAFPLGSRRMILAVATKNAVIIYDTQQKTPIAIVSNIHYTRLTDLTWSSDGRLLVVCSTDGYCSIVSFDDEELGETYVETAVANPVTVEVDIENNHKDDEIKTADKFKIPSSNDKVDISEPFKHLAKAKSPKVKSEVKPKIIPDVIDEAAMQPWSDDSNTDMKSKLHSPIIEECSEDIQLVYEESQSNVKINHQTPNVKLAAKQTFANLTDKKASDDPSTAVQNITTPPKSKDLSESSARDVSPVRVPNPGTTDEQIADQCHTPTSKPKTPRRVSFVTLSSPKNPKKKA